MLLATGTVVKLLKSPLLGGFKTSCTISEQTYIAIPFTS
jgi:hypothetical protein